MLISYNRATGLNVIRQMYKHPSQTPPPQKKKIIVKKIINIFNYDLKNYCITFSQYHACAFYYVFKCTSPNLMILLMLLSTYSS